jgi:hypothetical protein
MTDFIKEDNEDNVNEDNEEDVNEDEEDVESHNKNFSKKCLIHTESHLLPILSGEYTNFITDKLLIVAHPGDEVLCGGFNLLSQSGWYVICLTHKNDRVRSKEFNKTMSYTGITKYEMFNVKNIENKDFDQSEFEYKLKNLSKYKWKLVLTHNEKGEYGNLHRQKVNELVKRYFKNVKVFTRDRKVKLLDQKRQLMQYYKDTQNICEMIYEGKYINRDFYYEKLFVHPKKRIPLFIHQIWFGDELDKKNIRSILLKKVKHVAKENNFGYKLWTNDYLTEENFPITWKYITIVKKYGKKRYAQIADLCRYELVNRYGGVYLDSLFEISSKFCDYIKKHSSFSIIVANEDPCDLNCKSDKKYLSNGFFATVSGCPSLQNLLHRDSLEQINFKNDYINRETGPYFFRKGIVKRDAHIIQSELIYPFMTHDSSYRKGVENPCEGIDCIKKFKSLAVYQSGHGFSWNPNS